jgi:hypothetical protein
MLLILDLPFPRRALSLLARFLCSTPFDRIVFLSSLMQELVNLSIAYDMFFGRFEARPREFADVFLGPRLLPLIGSSHSKSESLRAW